MAFASTYPAAKAALIALWDAAVAVPVINGPTIGVGQDGVVTVGYQDENTPVVIDAVMLREASGLNLPEREQYTIYCAVGVNYGSTDVAPAETAVFTLWAALGGVLEANFTLGGVVMSAGVNQYQLWEQQAADGITVVLKFGVFIDAFTTV